MKEKVAETERRNNYWSFEIPVTDLERAIEFYQVVFEVELRRSILFGKDVALFNNNLIPLHGVLICVSKSDKIQSNQRSIVIPVNSRELLLRYLTNVEKAGGQISIEPSISGYQDKGAFQDLDGNEVGILVTESL